MILFQNYFYNDDIGKLKHKAHVTEKADVVVVGGGIVGLASLYSLLQKRIDAILIDSNTIGFRASGRSLGTASASLNLGIKPFLESYDQFVENNKILKKIIKNPTGIDCGLIENGEIILTTNELNIKSNDRIEVLSKTDVNNLYKVKNFKGGFFVPNSVSFNPYRLITHLIIHCESSGSRIYEGVFPIFIEQKDGKVFIETDGDQKIECNKVIFCDPFYYKFKYDKKLKYRLFFSYCTPILSNSMLQDLPHNLIYLLDFNCYIKIHDSRIFFYSPNFFNLEKTKKIICRLFRLDNLIITYYWYGKVYYMEDKYFILNQLNDNIIYNTAYNNHAFSWCFYNANKIANAISDNKKLGG